MDNLFLIGCNFTFNYVTIIIVKLDQVGKLNMQYKSTIKSRPYLYKETKKAATLIIQRVMVDEIKNKSIKDNIFQLESEARKKESIDEVVEILRSKLRQELDKDTIISLV